MQMSPTLRALLAAIATVGVTTVYVLTPSADPEQVKTLALADGFVARAAEAEFRLSDEGIAWLADAGISVGRYARLQFPVGLGVGKEWDGGNAVILPDLPLHRLRSVTDRLESVDLATCAARPNVCPLWGDRRPFRLAPHQCAWKPTSGAACGRVNPDGGAALDPGIRNTMQPGEWTGTGCLKKTCVIIAGDIE